MRYLTVTTEGEDGGLSLRQAIALAGNRQTTIRFDEDVTSISLETALDVFGRAKITIEGDKDGDGIGDVFLDTDEHHFTIGRNAALTLRDISLHGGSDYSASGIDGASASQIAENAAAGADGEIVKYGKGGADKALARHAVARLDGEDGDDGQNGADGGRGENAETAAGSIHNFGSLALERVGFWSNWATGGDGGQGGVGGRGANGGIGGSGAPGHVKYPAGGEIVDSNNRDGGRGGNGGDGGDGGTGGAGGRGGDAAALIHNYETGKVELKDVAIGGRMAHGLLTDKFGQKAEGGDGGLGGDGGVAGEGQRGGNGGDDARLAYNGTPTGKFSRWHDTFNGMIEKDDPLFLERTWGDGTYRKWAYEAEWFTYPTTTAGVGGAGGAGGDGGNGGANGNGGHAAMLVNYGTLRGQLTSGTQNKAEAGFGGPDDVTFRTSEGQAATPGRLGGGGGDEQYNVYHRSLNHLGEPVVVQMIGTHVVNTQGGYGLIYALLPNSLEYIPIPPGAADGADGPDGRPGDDGVLGTAGEDRVDVYSEGKAGGLATAGGLVYLAGVRQSDDFGKLLFTLVRVGDTSESVSVTYSIGGVGGEGVSRSDFRKPGQLTKTVTFDAIDQQAATFDRDGKGIARIEIDLRADGIREGAEGFRIKLASGDVDLGTKVFRGDVWDADYRSVNGTDGNDKRLVGSRRDDVIDAKDGNDGLFGKNGRDVLIGGDGKDTLNGGNGADTHSGGAGGDRFVFAGRKSGADVIEDFGKGDVIDLTAYDGLRFRDLAVSKTGGGTLVKWDGGSVLLEDMKKVQVDASDFDFA